ncbi:hypothetical protein M501DRAFT_667462 [Patellaria atrata CBS 101060]|uniref:Uncharacterized protein n=1 Tax=Patellaria atrata CBS 101060 TaxID=1346257 RepID=A0A9P4SES4_9PEZI|nr:hypothetical protein M501DRAFT_667462 [Patellaria atrata CBS 101060]
MLTMRQDVLYGNSVTSEVKFKTVTSKSMGKINGKNNYEESKYMRGRPSLNIPILHSSIWWCSPCSLCSPLEHVEHIDHIT